MICLHPTIANDPARAAQLQRNIAAAAESPRQKAARASEYRRALIHDSNFAEHIAADLQKSNVLHSLMAISVLDSCAAGGMLAELFEAYIEQMADKLASDDHGHLFDMPRQESLDTYVQHVEAAVAQLRGFSHGTV